MKPPFAKLQNVELGQARWTGGFWGDRFAQCQKTMVPAMGRLMTQSQREKFLGNFEVAAGLAQGKHRGPRWNDGDFYKWLEGAAAVYAASKDPQLDAEMDRSIDLIGKAQRADGYIHTDVQIKQAAGLDVHEFGDPMDFEMYNMGHLMSAACVHRRATGKTSLLQLATRAADYLARVFEKPTPQQARHGICPSHLVGLIDLARTTGERRHVELATKLLNMRDLVTNGDDDNQDRVPLRQQTVAHGHGVRATYLYAGAADIYTETGDESLLPPLQSVWQDLVSRKLYITGGCGALFDGASPDGSEDQAHITRVHQAFGRNYQLPHGTAHNETCAAIGNLLWNWRMLQITGESRFADVIETTLYNSVLAGVGLDGESYFYTNTLRKLDPMPVELRWPQQRQKVLSCFCCPPNVVRTVARSSEFAYAKSDRGVYLVLYGTSELETTLDDGTRVRLKQETDYPWDGKVRITVDSSGEYSLVLRIPDWCRNASIDGTPQVAGFHELRRRWKAGDVVEIELPMPVRIVEANPYVEETRNQVAVMRGPIVYCVESVDLPPGMRVLDVHLPRDAKPRPRPSDLLGGVTVIESKAIAVPSGGWSDQLYREVSVTNRREFDLRLIPYYAWDNRGPSEMSVWLPLA